VACQFATEQPAAVSGVSASLPPAAATELRQHDCSQAGHGRIKDGEGGGHERSVSSMRLLLTKGSNAGRVPNEVVSHNKMRGADISVENQGIRVLRCSIVMLPDTPNTVLPQFHLCRGDEEPGIVVGRRRRRAGSPS
jgi:hypothetical protein